MSRMNFRRTAKPASAFNARARFDMSGLANTVVKYGRGDTIFTQGDACEDVLYIKTGCVTLSVQSKTGRQAVVATLGPGQFFGEGSLAGQQVRIGSATAMTPSVILRVGTVRMGRLLHGRHALSDRFISHMLSRNNQIEKDLITQLFSSSEKRLARTLLLLARYGLQGKPIRMVPKTSHETLANSCGATLSRVKFFLNKFRKLGFIEYNSQNRLSVNSSLLSVVLHD